MTRHHCTVKRKSTQMQTMVSESDALRCISNAYNFEHDSPIALVTPCGLNLHDASKVVNEL